jgi:type IV pilus assembly protein PilC
VVILLMVYVIPQLTEVLKGTEQELPLSTQMVMAASDFFKKEWWLILLILTGLIIALFRFVKSKNGKDFFDKNLLKIPVLGTFLKKFYLTRLALNLSTLISGGLPITQALEITGEVVGNEVYQEIMSETRDQVRKGETISSVLKKHPQTISPLFYQMVAVGEKTGSMGSSLKNVVEFYQQDIDRSLDNFIRLLEPIFIIILGGVVAGLMGAVLLPIYSTGLM